MFVNIHTDLDNLEQVTNTLTGILPYVELKRLDTLDKGMDLSFICKAQSLEQISKMKDAIQKLSENTRLSIIDQPDLIL
jgi:hypothetical protein